MHTRCEEQISMQSTRASLAALPPHSSIAERSPPDATHLDASCTSGRLTAGFDLRISIAAGRYDSEGNTEHEQGSERAQPHHLAYSLARACVAHTQ